MLRVFPVLYIYTVVPYNLTLSAEPSPKVAFGGNVTLTCSSEGGPSLNYTLVTPNKGNVTSQMLAVSNVMTDDAGVYYCVVTSEAGTSSLNITITGLYESADVNIFLKG